MAVPDTDNFSLIDVKTELESCPDVSGTVDSLTEAFSKAGEEGYDVAYKGSKDRQSNFRNYDCDNIGTWTKVWLFDSSDNESPSYLDPGCSAAYISNTETDFNIARNAATGDDIDWFEEEYYKATMQKVGIEYIFRRTNITFDLRSFSGMCYAAELHLCIASGTFGVDNVVVCTGTANPQSGCLTTADYDSFTFDSFELEGTFSTYVDGAYTWLKIEASASDLITIGTNRFGSYWNLMIIEEDHDNDNSLPGDTDKHGFVFYRGPDGFPALQPYLMLRTPTP